MVRLFVAATRAAEVSEVALAEDEIHYLVRVHRLRAGDGLTTFDGAGGTRTATLLPGERSLALGPLVVVESDARFAFELWQGLPKSDKLEWVVQKAAELGVARIVPMACERSVVKLAGARAENRIARLAHIAREASRQCGRADVADVEAVSDLAAFARLPAAGVRCALVYELEQENGLEGFLATIPLGARLALAVGPEGGFSADEVSAARAAGVTTVGLGRLILRTETAAIVVCALAQAAAGGFLAPPSAIHRAAPRPG